MCNLSQGVEERGIAIGEERGIAIGEEKTIFKMYDKNYPLEQIADIMDKTVSEVEEIIRRKAAN